MYKRLAKRLLAPTAPIYLPPQAPPTPPPDDSAVREDAAGQEPSADKAAKERQQWRDDALIDFASFESNLARVQFLFRSNELERDRYAAEKDRILKTAQSVKENNGRLHQQLAEVRDTLALRKTYDVLAADITTDSALKPRDQQHTAIDKLQSEIAQLERECSDYATTWGERREQFGKIVEEGTNLLRLIREEKEEAERQEGMEGIEGGSSPPHPSRASTPKLPDDTTTSDAGTSKQQHSLKPPEPASATPIISRGSSPASKPSAASKDVEEDVEMDTAPEALEEGEEADGPSHTEGMELV